MRKPTVADLPRRRLLQSIFFGAAGAPAALLSSPARAQASSGLSLPKGPLADIPPLEKKTLVAGALPGIDDEVFAPPGFDVRCVARQGLNPLSGQPDPEGFEWHIDPDGGAVFPSHEDGGWVYVSNSEETPGGVGALRFDADGNVIAAYPILEGTRNNCAGGPTPWGTWLSCEETSGGLVYECDPFGTPDDAQAKPALGAFPHEAAAIDPLNHVCYMTEDGGDQRFYRFVSAPDDLSTLADGTVRMGLASGELQVLNIQGFANGGYPAAEAVREPLPVSWVAAGCNSGVSDPTGTFPYDSCDLASNGMPLIPANAGTEFLGGEGIWYYELPEAVRSIPAGGQVPTRGVIFFTTKGDNRVWALDLENQLIELIFDNENMQIETGFDDVDNLVVSPTGDVLVAEDGQLMRLVVVVPNQPAKLLMQITKGGSEITGPAFSPDGSRLYFSSQRGPSGSDGSGTGGATYEMRIPEAYRLTSVSDEDDLASSDAPATSSGSGALGLGLAGIAAAALWRQQRCQALRDEEPQA